MKQVRQAVSKESLFVELEGWCRAGAGHKRDILQIMSAFASGRCIEALEPAFDAFLSNGNFIQVIIGIDRGGTDREAIRRLHELRKNYSTQFSCHVFNAPSNYAIFHPKLYLYRSKDKLSAILGSANLTLGGFANNFESIFIFDGLSLKSKEAKELLATWTLFASPQDPLKRKFLRALEDDYAAELVRTLPKYTKAENKNYRGRAAATLWHPVSKIKMPRRSAGVDKAARADQTTIKKFLVIDILDETRQTQMQLPLDVVERFFGIPRAKASSIRLSYIRAGQLTTPFDRQIVISSGKRKSRLMRRIEMPPIAGEARPLAAMFLRLRGQHFAVAIIPQRTSAYRTVDRFLRNHGEQPARAQRRYYLGSADDRHLRGLRPILKLTALSSSGRRG